MNQTPGQASVINQQDTRAVLRAHHRSLIHKMHLPFLSRSCRGICRLSKAFLRIADACDLRMDWARKWEGDAAPSIMFSLLCGRTLTRKSTGPYVQSDGRDSL